MTSPPPDLGDFFVVRTEGWAARVIRVVTRSDVNHAGVYVGDGRIVEAQPAGAAFNQVDAYPNARWSHVPLSGVQRQAIVAEAVALIGTPYSWVDVVCIGLADLFGWSVPEPIRHRLRGKGELMCSQLVDTAYLRAGVHLFNDGRLPGDVAPSDLERFTT